MSELIFALFGGVNMSFAILSLLIWLKNRKDKVFLYFGLFSLFSGFYFLLSSFSSYLNQDWSRLIIFCAGVYYSIFTWFVFSYSKISNQKISWGFSSLFFLAVVLFILRLDSPFDILWQIVAHAGLFGLILILFYGTKVLYTKSIKEANALLVLTIIFCLLALEEVFRTYTEVNLLGSITLKMQPLDIFPIMFSILIGIRLSIDIHKKRELKIELLRKELSENKLRLELEEKKVIELKLLNNSKDLKDFGIEINRKNEFVKKLYLELDEYHKKNDRESIELKNILASTKSHLQIDKELFHFQKNIDKINSEFITNIKGKYPELSKSELHMISLLRLKLDSKEIANIKGISVDSVKVLRYRIRKKMNLLKSVNLVDFLQGF